MALKQKSIFGKNILFFLMLGTSITSCAIPKRIRKELSPFIYNEKDTFVGELIRTNGYFKGKTIWLSNPTDTLYSNFMFFADGICVASRITNPSFEENNAINENFFNWTADAVAKEPNFYDTIVFRWGYYFVSGDTIVANYIYKPYCWSVNDGWDAWRVEYLIIDKNTVQEIKRSSLGVSSADKMNAEIIEKRRVVYPAKFTETENSPPSDCWLKEEKWIWKNEQDWEDYMKRMKQKKKEMRRKRKE